MTELANFLPSSGWQRLMADAVWQSTLLAIGALAVARLCHARPALRAGITLVAAVLCVAVPLVSATARFAGWGLLNQRTISAVQVTLKEPVQPMIVHHAAAVSAPVVPSNIDWQLRWLAVAWLVASGGLAWRLLRSALAVRRLVQDSASYDDDRMHTNLIRAAEALRVRPPELLLCEAIDSPALVMWGRPRLLLPAQVAERDDWFAVFCHEMAHLRRRDGWSRLMLESVVILLPWQPLVWLLRREFRAACEEACDDWAVAAGADPVELASLLADFIPQSRPALVLGMSESVPATRHRILRLLAMQGIPRPQLGRVAGLAGWGVAIVLALILALLQRGSGPRGGKDLPPWGNTSASQAAASIVPFTGSANKEYRIETPDILLIDAVKLVPKAPYHIEPLDTLEVGATGVFPDQPIKGQYKVDPSGMISLGPSYGKVGVGGQTVDDAKETISKHLLQILRDPAVSVELAQLAGQQQISGEHLVGPDGRVVLGVYGSVPVIGMSISEAKEAIEKQLSKYLEQPRVSVGVFAYNSKVYYVITEKADGDAVTRIPITGNDTVLDALAQVNSQNLTLSNCWVWVARSTNEVGEKGQVLPVDWKAIIEGTDTHTNWQIMPGDRVFVREKH